MRESASGCAPNQCSDSASVATVPTSTVRCPSIPNARQGFRTGKITRIAATPDKERYWIHVDGKYCCAIRARTFKAMGLAIDQET